jgi:hypothetical protein
MREKPTNATIIHSVYKLCMLSPTCFGITLTSSGSVPSAFWELLNWGAVDRILWMVVLCLVMWCALAKMHGSRSKIPSKNLVRRRCAEGFNYGVKGLILWAQQHYVAGDSNDRLRQQHSYIHFPECSALLLTGGFIVSVFRFRYISFVFKLHHLTNII